MNPIYSKTTEYALRSLAYMASRPSGSASNIQTISRALKIPSAYVAKVFGCLAQTGIVHSRRGVNGGFTLAVKPEKLTLLRIIQALDDFSESAISGCVMGLKECSDAHACPLHDRWVKAKKHLMEGLSENTVLDLIRLNGKYKNPGTKSRKLSTRMRKMFTLKP